MVYTTACTLAVAGAWCVQDQEKMHFEAAAMHFETAAMHFEAAAMHFEAAAMLVGDVTCQAVS